MNAARSMELFLIDGRPDGMLTAGVFNWTGHVLRVPRTQPSGSSLSKADTANMESFLDTLMMVLPAIRVDNFLSKKRAISVPATAFKSLETKYECKVPRHGVHAFASVADGELVVQKGSVVRSTWTGDRSQKSSYSALHDALIEDGTIKDGIMQSNYAFKSPSAAAAVVSGRSANGRTSWTVTGTGQTYADWEAAQLQDATP